MKKIPFSLKFLSDYFYGQSFIQTVRGPYTLDCSWCYTIANTRFLPLTLTLGSRPYDALYPLHHVTYAPGYVQQCRRCIYMKKILFILWHLPWGPRHKKLCAVPTTSCDLCTCKFWFVIRKYIIFHWPWGQGHMKHCPAPITSCDLCTCKVEVATSNSLGEYTITRNVT